MRVSEDWYKLSQQLRSAAIAAAAEPGWTGPTAAELQAMSDQILAKQTEIRERMLLLGISRTELRDSVAEGRNLMRRVDHLTTALFGRGSGDKIRFGVKPEDLTRNIHPLPDAPRKLALLDHPEGALAKWKGTQKATYEIQVFLEPDGELPARTLISTRMSIPITGFAPGTQIFVRVRARLSGRWSEWSEVVQRYLNA